jgi:cytochrome c biogenesis protein CcmG/thiol:disulfide interchange protein DsbE
MERRRLLLLAPFGATVVAGGAFIAMLNRATQGKFDVHEVPSQLMGKPVPPFALPGDPGFASTDLTGRVTFVNFFASWCEPCAEEAPVLDGLKQAGVPLYGIAYKDKPEPLAAYLAARGNPYVRIGHDDPGRVAIDWGITGVPETYLVDAHGIVRWRYVGPLTPEAVSAGLQPALKKYA